LPADHARPLARRLRAGAVQGRGAPARAQGERGPVAPPQLTARLEPTWRGPRFLRCGSARTAPTMTRPLSASSGGRNRLPIPATIPPYGIEGSGGDRVTEITYTVPDMSCSHCEHAVSSELLAVAGV